MQQGKTVFGAVGAASLIGALTMSPLAGANDVAGNAFLRDSLRSVSDEVAAYRPILQSLVKDPRGGREARDTLVRVDALLAESRRLAQETKLPEALRRGEEAKKLAVETMVRLKSGETVTHGLSFASPADEYAYEQRRLESYEMLLAMSLRESDADAGARKRAAGEADEAGKLKQAATSDAAAGRHSEAIRRMETASQHLTRALQALGMPVF